jgi:hypothetical protein
MILLSLSTFEVTGTNPATTAIDKLDVIEIRMTRMGAIAYVAR